MTRTPDRRGARPAGRESPALAQARARLAQAETALDSEDGLRDLNGALALLEEAAETAATAAARALASRLGRSHARAVYARIEERLADRALTEPALEHLFRVVRAFDDRCFPLPERSRAVKIEIVRRLIERYHEAYGPAEKRRLLGELTGIAAE